MHRVSNTDTRRHLQADCPHDRVASISHPSRLKTCSGDRICRSVLCLAVRITVTLGSSLPLLRNGWSITRKRPPLDSFISSSAAWSCETCHTHLPAHRILPHLHWFNLAPQETRNADALVSRLSVQQVLIGTPQYFCYRVDFHVY